MSIKSSHQHLTRPCVVGVDLSLTDFGAGPERGHGDPLRRGTQSLLEGPCHSRNKERDDVRPTGSFEVGDQCAGGSVHRVPPGGTSQGVDTTSSRVRSEVGGTVEPTRTPYPSDAWVGRQQRTTDTHYLNVCLSTGSVPPEFVVGSYAPIVHLDRRPETVSLLGVRRPPDRP